MTDVPQMVLTGEPTSPGRLLSALWSSRELCLTLARKEFFVRYRRAMFGLAWAVALPALQAVVLAVILSRVARFNIPHYGVFIFAGTVAWAYFSASLSAGTTAIVDNASLSSKIYFPRAVLPVAACAANVFALVIGVVILLVASIAAGVSPGVRTLYLLPGVVLSVALSVALAVTASALHVYLRDVKYGVQAALLVWFYVTPIFYPITWLHGAIASVVRANPVTSVVEMFQAAALPGVAVDPTAIVATVGWTAALAVTGLVLHCRFDRLFADLM